MVTNGDNGQKTECASGSSQPEPVAYDNDNDFLTKLNESDNKYLHMRRWDEKIITKMSEEIWSACKSQEWKLDGGLFSGTIER